MKDYSLIKAKNEYLVNNQKEYAKTSKNFNYQYLVIQ